MAGLRREEVAQLASISTDYYTRLEQGRMQASAPVLDVLARVLHLDDDERGYLFQLAGKTTTRTRRRGRQKVQPQLQRVLDDLTATPAIVQGRRGDILAWNALAAALVTDFSRDPGEAPQLPADPLHRPRDAHPVRGLEDLARRSPWPSCGWKPRSIPRTLA